MSGYPHQTTEHNASIEAYRDDEDVRIEVFIGQLASVTLLFDPETAWRFARDVTKAAREAAPELIGALEGEQP